MHDMHDKNIKRIIRNKLKLHFPNWNRLKRKTKKEIIREVKEEISSSYDFGQKITAPKEELLGIDQQIPTDGILTLEKMASFVETISNNNIIKFCKYDGSAGVIKDDELRFIHDLIDDQVINRLLSYDGYSPAMRDFFPCNLFRAELLKVIQFPEISYRKFCKEKYFGLEQKENRAFMGLSLREKTIIDHTQLSQFRKSLTFVQQVNLLVYILHHFMKSGLLADNHLHAVDSTELASDCKLPLASFKINGQKVRIYNDLDCDCGKRRKKRDKSIYVIGYRLHTLTAIDPKTHLSFPLISLLAPANHHDSNFLPFLVNLAQAMGIDVKLITADEAYHDKDGSLFDDTGASVVTPPSSKVAIPENVDSETGTVFCHDQCSVPMLHLGVEDQLHEYKCGVGAGECPRAGNCPQARFVPIDSGMFQRIPYHLKQVQQVLDIRKNCERPFNLLKNQTGLETVRVRSQHATMARCTLSSIAVLLIKMAGKRKKQAPKKSKQMSLFQEQKVVNA